VLGELVDFHALRKSLTKQLVAAYIAFTGKEKKLSLLAKTFAVGVGTSYAEPMIAQLINEQTLIDLLSKGEGAGQRFRRTLLRSPSPRRRAAGRPGGPPNTVYLRPDKSPDQQFKVKLSLHDLQ